MRSGARILVVDDDPGIRRGLAAILADLGEVATAEDGESGIREALVRPPDLILLDILMPGLDGIAVCRRMRAHEALARTQILMLTAVDEERRRIECFAAGADDLVGKPFRSKEFIARVKARLRRAPCAPGSTSVEAQILRCGNMALDCGRMEARLASGGEYRVDLTASEFRFLRFFVENADAVLTRAQIVDRVWEREVSERVVDNQVFGLRKKLAPFDRQIVSVYGAGYALREKRFS